MKLSKHLTLLASAIVMSLNLTACGGSGDVGTKEFPAQPTKTADELFLEDVGQFAADFYKIPRESFYLYFDDINRDSPNPIIREAYRGIPEDTEEVKWTIYGISWNNSAVVHSGLVTDKYQVAETAEHEICHVAQRSWGYELSWYDEAGALIPYPNRWYEAQCKYMGMYLANEYFLSRDEQPPQALPEGWEALKEYWYRQTLTYPQPPLTPTGEPLMGQESFDIIWGKNLEEG